MLAKKYDGSLRFYNDDRKVNDVTVRDAYKILQMDKCQHSLDNASILMTLETSFRILVN